MPWAHGERCGSAEGRVASNQLAPEPRTLHRSEKPMDRKAHWNQLYATTAPDAVSWFQAEPSTSVQLLDTAGMTPST